MLQWISSEESHPVAHLPACQIIKKKNNQTNVGCLPHPNQIYVLSRIFVCVFVHQHSEKVRSRQGRPYRGWREWENNGLYFHTAVIPKHSQAFIFFFFNFNDYLFLQATKTYAFSRHHSFLGWSAAAIQHFTAAPHHRKSPLTKTFVFLWGSCTSVVEGKPE